MTVNRTKPAARSPRKPKGLGHERREEILDAALALFGKHGVYAVSTRQISEAVGLSQPALYAHFRSKDEICETLMQRAFEELARRQRAVAARAKPQNRLRRLALEYVTFGLENPDAYRIAFMYETHEQAPKEYHASLLAGISCFNVLRTEVARLIAEHRLDKDADTVAQCFWALLHGLVSLFLARSGFPWVAHKQLIDTQIDIGCRYLGLP